MPSRRRRAARRRLPATGRTGPRAATPGPASRTGRAAWDTGTAGAANSRPGSDQLQPRGDQHSLGTLSAAPKSIAGCSGRSGGARAARRGAAGGEGQARAGGAEGPVGGKRRHHVGERDVRGAAGSARPGPGHSRGAGAGGTGNGTGWCRGRGSADGALCPQEIRKVVQALEQTAREILTLLQGVHQGPGFQHSEFRAAARAAENSSGRELGSALSRGPFSRVQPLPGPSAWLSRKLRGRGERSWEVSSQTSSKAAVQHYGHRSVPFSLPSGCFSVSLQGSVSFSKCSRPGPLSWLLGHPVSGLHITLCYRHLLSL